MTASTGTTAPPSTSAPSRRRPPPVVGPPTTPPSTAPRRPGVPTNQLRMKPVRLITGAISPSRWWRRAAGVVFAQNMIYHHTVTAYDQDGTLLATIPDEVDLAAFGISGHPPGRVKGGPVEMAFSVDGKSAYVSNYSMYGPGFGP